MDVNGHRGVTLMISALSSADRLAWKTNNFWIQGQLPLIQSVRLQYSNGIHSLRTR